jgi:hypothetical protein
MRSNQSKLPALCRAASPGWHAFAARGVGMLVVCRAHAYPRRESMPRNIPKRQQMSNATYNNKRKPAALCTMQSARHALNHRFRCAAGHAEFGSFARKMWDPFLPRDTHAAATRWRPTTSRAPAGARSTNRPPKLYKPRAPRGFRCNESQHAVQIVCRRRLVQFTSFGKSP